MDTKLQSDQLINILCNSGYLIININIQSIRYYCFCEEALLQLLTLFPKSSLGWVFFLNSRGTI